MTGYFRLSAIALLFAAPTAICAERVSIPVRQALNRLYNFDFTGANNILDAQIQATPDQSLPYTFRAASLLFKELDRLRILEGEFFADDKRIIDKKKLQADPEIKRVFYEYVEVGRERARRTLETQPNDTDSLFTLCITSGLVLDYVGLVERRQLRSLQHAKESHGYAVKLLKLDPTFTDAYMTTGLTEYLLGSLPFFIRWFIRFEGVQGDKNLAETNLKKVVSTGRYLGPFAKILLSILYLREKRPRECEQLLGELARDYPENALIRKELVKVSKIGAAPD